MYKFKFADIGEGLHEGVVAEIYKNVGDEVKEGDSLFSVETDKVTSDIPSPVTGKISKVLMNLGDTIHVGDDIYHIDDGSKGTVDEPSPKKEKNNASAASVVGTIEVSDKVVDFSSMKKTNSGSQGKVRSGKIGNNINVQDGVLTTPLARALASEKNIDITTVKGTGSNGRVLISDVESHTTSSPSKRPVHTNGENKIVDVTPIRKAIAKAMKTSWSTVAYTNLVNEVNMTKLWDARKTVVDYIMETHGVKVTFTAYAAKATARALREFPALNAKYDEASGKITQFGYVNLGLAVDTPKGLVVPVIKNADTKSLIEIARDIIEIATKARNGQLTAADMSGGTFTLTNYGSAGALSGVPVINVGEMGILGTGAIINRVFGNDDGTFYNGKVMNLTCAADHRWVDGAEIGRFITRVKELLEKPSLLDTM